MWIGDVAYRKGITWNTQVVGFTRTAKQARVFLSDGSTVLVRKRDAWGGR
jgi:hypothetical protein